MIYMMKNGRALDHGKRVENLLIPNRNLGKFG